MKRLKSGAMLLMVLAMIERATFASGSQESGESGLTTARENNYRFSESKG